MVDADSLQDSQKGVPGNIQIPQEDATVASAASVASQGSAAIFQQRARHTLLEIGRGGRGGHRGGAGRGSGSGGQHASWDSTAKNNNSGVMMINGA
jgi:hypothetical protein